MSTRVISYLKEITVFYKQYSLFFYWLANPICKGHKFEKNVKTKIANWKNSFFYFIQFWFIYSFHTKSFVYSHTGAVVKTGRKNTDFKNKSVPLSNQTALQYRPLTNVLVK